MLLPRGYVVAGVFPPEQVPDVFGYLSMLGASILGVWGTSPSARPRLCCCPVVLHEHGCSKSAYCVELLGKVTYRESGNTPPVE
eukprot:8284947-Pyramimonas_sp.AAC.1